MVNGGGIWGIFNGILGWTNSATYGSVVSYNLYWAFVIASFIGLRFREVHGHWPLVKPKVPQSPPIGGETSPLLAQDNEPDAPITE
jgi:high-affinity iron transporter